MHANYLEGKLTIKTKKITLSFPFWYLEILVLYIEGEKKIFKIHCFKKPPKFSFLKYLTLH